MKTKWTHYLNDTINVVEASCEKCRHNLLWSGSDISTYPGFAHCGVTEFPSQEVTGWRGLLQKLFGTAPVKENKAATRRVRELKWIDHIGKIARSLPPGGTVRVIDKTGKSCLIERYQVVFGIARGAYTLPEAQ